MAAKNPAAEFRAKIAPALKTDAGRTELNKFIKTRIEDQPALLDCLWEFSKNFSADWDRLADGPKNRGLAIFYALFSRAVALAGPSNELADFVLYVDGLARESLGGKKDKWQLRPPNSVTPQMYAVYLRLWNKMPKSDQQRQHFLSQSRGHGGRRFTRLRL